MLYPSCANLCLIPHLYPFSGMIHHHGSNLRMASILLVIACIIWGLCIPSVHGIKSFCDIVAGSSRSNAKPTAVPGIGRTRHLVYSHVFCDISASIILYSFGLATARTEALLTTSW
ncbi:hypothetical protein B0O99DRAFT_628841 [Bisporella sp. PMI_857]|nr:hypothetical protein B0O99DRAFT_628841 [Bisporella sp. PMI_857]